MLKKHPFVFNGVRPVSGAFISITEAVLGVSGHDGRRALVARQLECHLTNLNKLFDKLPTNQTNFGLRTSFENELIGLSDTLLMNVHPKLRKKIQGLDLKVLLEKPYVTLSKSIEGIISGVVMLTNEIINKDPLGEKVVYAPRIYSGISGRPSMADTNEIFLPVLESSDLMSDLANFLDSEDLRLFGGNIQLSREAVSTELGSNRYKQGASKNFPYIFKDKAEGLHIVSKEGVQHPIKKSATRQESVVRCLLERWNEDRSQAVAKFYSLEDLGITDEKYLSDYLQWTGDTTEKKSLRELFEYDPEQGRAKFRLKNPPECDIP